VRTEEGRKWKTRTGRAKARSTGRGAKGHLPPQIGETPEEGEKRIGPYWKKDSQHKGGGKKGGKKREKNAYQSILFKGEGKMSGGSGKNISNRRRLLDGQKGNCDPKPFCGPRGTGREKSHVCVEFLSRKGGCLTKKTKIPQKRGYECTHSSGGRTSRSGSKKKKGPDRFRS